MRRSCKSIPIGKCEEVSCRALQSLVRQIKGIKMGDDSVLTLKVENASDATSKLGNSTNLKNNTKLADSNMYLKNTQKIHKVKTV